MNELTRSQDSRRLTAPEFQGLAEVPPELEWFANLDYPRTRRAYERDVRDFMGFIGIGAPAEFRTVTRAHLIAWRKDLEHRVLARATIRRKLSALSSLFQYLCEKNAVAHNPVDGVKRPTAHISEGATPALSDAQARTLLNAPPEATLKGKRDRAIQATLLYHGLRRAEL
jgi:site-specific recombinase XerD